MGQQRVYTVKKQTANFNEKGKFFKIKTVLLLLVTSSSSVGFVWIFLVLNKRQTNKRGHVQWKHVHCRLA